LDRDEAISKRVWQVIRILILFMFMFIGGRLNAAGCLTTVDITGVIGVATVDLLDRAREDLEAKGCEGYFLRINTPGGNLQSTRIIVQEILNSTKPYICLITPNGAHAGSAGAIIMQACHVAGALKATNMGAATPVSGDGQEMGKDMRNKIVNDTVSWLESIAVTRGRSVDFARDIITEGKAVTAEKALELKAIDLVTENEDEFLTALQGREIVLNSDLKVSLSENLSTSLFEGGIRHEVLQLLSNPQISYLLFMGSLGLLYFELTNPGVIAPGILGAMGLILSMVTFHMMDVYWGGLALIFLGVGLLILEVFVTSFGLLGIGGVISFVLGSLLMFDEAKTGYSISIATVLPTAVFLGLVMVGSAYLAVTTRDVKRKNALDDFPGTRGEIKEVSKNGKAGKVFVHGELWKFKSDEELNPGDEAVVVEAHGLTLKVKKA
jgi:membrane-bound serine protease (ClpP class)